MGSDQDLVRLGYWNAAALYHDTLSNHWFANVQDYTGYTAADVAAILSDSPHVYRAQVTAEEGYGSANDPLDPLSFSFDHPHYDSQEWIGPGHFGVVRLPAGPCVYGGTFNISGDSRLWYTGDGGQYCSFTLS